MSSKVSFLFLALLALAPQTFADDRVERLPQEYRRWLEEEVVYIITDSEREVFLSLGTQEERERFIEAFWRVRDPDPATKENEFQTEHFRRLVYAKEKLSRETARPGWKTDRGRMYIILGEPRQITRFEAENEIVQSELWVYPSEPEKGIPSSFNLLFFRRRGLGEYELYDPVLHGPNALMTGYQYSPTADNEEALQVLQKISPELARAALTLDLDEPVDFVSRRPALGTSILLSRIEASAKRSVRSDYAEAYLRYGDRVSADYSFRYVPNESGFWVLYGQESTPFVHFTVELAPENFALQRAPDDSRYYTTLDVTREVKTLDGVVVAVDDQEVSVDVPPQEFLQGAGLPFAYQDAFALVPGDYRVSVVLRNRAVHQFTVAEGEVRVPPLAVDHPALGGLLLGYLHEIPLSPESAGSFRAFQIGSDRVYPAVDGLFPIGAEMVTLTQVANAAPGSSLRISIRDGETTLGVRETKVPDAKDATVVESLQLFRVAGGRYEVLVELRDGRGSVVEQREAALVVSPLNAIVRPGFIYRRGFRGAPGLLALTRGEQLWALGRFDEATSEFFLAVGADNPELPEARWRLAGALLSATRADEALDLLAPMEERFSRRFEVIGGLGYAYYFKRDYGRARDLLERATTLRPPDSRLLNTLGRTYQELGELANAVGVFRRSLELDPSQEEIKKVLESIEPPSRD